jgi:radical SAM superfamily enzyme YgiQ (UPF0313 family)
VPAIEERGERATNADAGNQWPREIPGVATDSADAVGSPVEPSPEECTTFPALGKHVKVLMVWPSFPPSYWSGSGMMDILPEQAFLPPLGLATVAALCPASWDIQLFDRATGELSDEEILWADLVMVSAMNVQREDAHHVIQRASALGRRTMIGGPYASAEPEAVLRVADHVVVGEPDEVFGDIARDLETGRARRLYRIVDKPDVTKTPTPRFDLLKLENYSCMSVQFSRGCPFQCEFCDIITIYGRRPRAKRPDQLLRELEALVERGWRKSVFLVDDNFIGNHKLALAMTHELEAWQRRHRFPLMFFTEASMDLAQYTELLDSMVRANFFYVFMGVETPSAVSLKETRKFQNLRLDPLECIRLIQRHGLWITAGFIVGFDSDTDDIFDRQIEFIERSAIPWAMAGVLKAPPTTALHERMKNEGRLIKDEPAIDISSLPNFRTAMPLADLLGGLRRMLMELYEPSRFYARARRSLEAWHTHECQRPPRLGLVYVARVLARSVWKQGIRSDYRAAYWSFFLYALRRWALHPAKRYLAFMMIVSGHHFPAYAASVAEILARAEADVRRTRVAASMESGAAAVGLASV